MTPEQARIVILEDALTQAVWTADFLHNCLVNPSNGKMNGGYTYEYPEQILDRIKELESLVKVPKLCFHSYNDPDCKNCSERITSRIKLHKAKEILNENNNV